MNPRVSLCMIVRDEEQHLPRCLDSVQGLVDEIVIVDTGSRDGTLAIARQHGAIIKEIAWPNDFAAARNEALNRATGDWILSLDADEMIAPDSRAVLPALLVSDSCEGYYVTIQNLQGTRGEEGQHFEVAAAFRLWRNRPLYRFVGSIHEQILPVIVATRPKAVISQSPLTIIHFGYLTETVQAKGKQERNTMLLRAELARHPENQFLRFCLGGEYYLRGQYREAHGVLSVAMARTAPDASWRPPLVKYYAGTLLELGRWREALSFLQPELERYPDFTDLFFMVGAAHGRAGEHDKAMESFHACLRLGPAPCPPYWPVDPEVGSCRAYAALGSSCETAARYGEALAAYAKAAMSKRGWLEPLKRLAVLMAKRVDEAKMLRVLNAFYPEETTRDQVTIASLLAHAGRYDLALQRLEPLQLREALDRGGRFAYAFCLAKTSHPAEALAISEEDWHGSGFEPEVSALRLYCQVMQGQAPSDQLPSQRSELLALYAAVGSMLADDPPDVIAGFLKRLPHRKVLAKALERHRDAAGSRS